MIVMMLIIIGQYTEKNCSEKIFVTVISTSRMSNSICVQNLYLSGTPLKEKLLLTAEMHRNTWGDPCFIIWEDQETPDAGNHSAKKTSGLHRHVCIYIYIYKI